MKTLLYGILLIILIGFGGLVYKNAVEHPNRPIACPLDAKVCPDGTTVAREGLSCTFPVCPPPNVMLADAGVSFALPEGFVVPMSAPIGTDASIVATYSLIAATSSVASSTEFSQIVIRRYAVGASSTPLAVMQATAIGGASGTPVPVTAFSSSVIGTYRFTVVSIQRFEGVVDTAYYLARSTDTLRFDAIDRSTDWTNPQLDISMLPMHKALVKLLGTLQGF